MTVANRRVLSPRVEGIIVRILQLLMVGILLAGLFYGEIGVVVNAGVGLAITFLPGVLKRRFQFTMDIGIVLWISVAMFLHALGTLPFPGHGYLTPYKAVWWWDHMTHALSSSLVAGAGYATTRAIDKHSDSLVIPARFMFVYILLFVMAFGVVWELLEFYIAVVSELIGIGNVLTQYGLDDTILDLMYNTLGGLLVALFGTAHLAGISDQLAARFQSR